MDFPEQLKKARLAIEIYDALISSGLLKKGADLTPKQVDGLTGIELQMKHFIKQIRVEYPIFNPFYPNFQYR